MVGPLIAGTALQVGGAALGEVLSEDERDAAAAERRRALEIISNLRSPNLERLRFEELGPSAMEGVNPDEQAVADEKAVLARLQGITEGGGLDMQGRARLAEIQDQTGQMNRSRQEGILANMRARGQLGGGMEMAARMGAAGDAAQAANRGGMQTAADAERRYLESISMRGDVANRMRRDSFGERATRAQARDAIAKFNNMNRNRATEYNVTERPLRQFGMDYQKAGLASGAHRQAGADWDSYADRTRDRWTGAGQVAAQAAKTGYDYYRENKRQEREDERYGYGGGY